MQTRRQFLKASSVATICSTNLIHSMVANAESLSVPLGLQLYSVRQLLQKDFGDTLKQLGALGYREVEAAGYYDHSATEVNQAMKDAGLKLVSAHYSFDDLHSQFDQILAFNKEVGVGTIICSVPGKKPSADKTYQGGLASDYTLDDWRWNADQFNLLGEKFQAAGMKFGYHNHTIEFKATDGVIPFDELLRLTDSSKVSMEMDCGWVVVGGGDPIAYLRKYPTRISMLHVKDFKHPDPAAARPRGRVAELGQGYIDYRPILDAAAKVGHVTHCFVEQEGFDMPPMDSLKVDAEYMRGLGIR
jgi:sugar phosphate isomerase/epimerase